MVSFAQIRSSQQVKFQHPGKESRLYRLKRPWSHGRGYVVMTGVISLLLLSLGVLYLHQLWQKRSRLFQIFR